MYLYTNVVGNYPKLNPMNIKEELKIISAGLLQCEDMDVTLFKIQTLLNKYYLENDAQEKHNILTTAWANNKGNYGAHDNPSKRKKLKGLLDVLIEDISDNSNPIELSEITNDSGLPYIDPTIIEEIKNSTNSANFKLDRLVKICLEINSSYRNENYFAVAVAVMIRSLLDIVPPIFEKINFAQVVSNVSMSRSHKKQLETLQNSLRNYADGCIHIQINKAHPYPNKSNLNFSSDLSTLLELIKERLNLTN